MTEETKTEPTFDNLDIIKQELRILKDLREMLKAYTRVGPSDAAKLAGIWQWLGAMIQRSEEYIRDAKKAEKPAE